MVSKLYLRPPAFCGTAQLCWMSSVELEEASGWGLPPRGVGAAMGRWCGKLGTLSLLGGALYRQIGDVLYRQAIGSAKVNPAVLENHKLLL